jgi:hypothetical protein
MKSLYRKDMYQHIVSLIDAKHYHKAHLLLVTEFAAEKLLSNDTVKLSKLIKYFEPRLVSDWRRGAGFLNSYLELSVEFPDPYVTLGLDGDKLVKVKELLNLLADDLLNHWKLQSLHATADQKHLLVIFFKEAAMYLSTLHQSLGSVKVL